MVVGVTTAFDGMVGQKEVGDGATEDSLIHNTMVYIMIKNTHVVHVLYFLHT